MSYSMLALPFIAALTGWVTNFLAIKMLFHPRKPVNLGLFTVQGIFPKRHKQLAEKIGALVGEELVSLDDLKGQLTNSSHQEEVFEMVDGKIDTFLRTKLTAAMPMLAMIMSDSLHEKIKKTLMDEIKEIMPQVIETYASRVGEQIDVKQMVYDKVLNFSIEKLEDILFSIMKQEFKFIELVGAVLGFFIGVIQVAIIYFGG